MRMYPLDDETKKLRRCLDRVKTALKPSLPSDARLFPVGSIAKGTAVAGEADLDLYIITSEPAAAYKAIVNLFRDGHQKKGQLLIWTANVEGVEFDFVVQTPNAKKREDTIQHTTFFAQLSTKERREIIKAKAYFKTAGVYGAENGGIVGVCVEEMVRQYKTFRSVCKLLAENSRPFIQDPTLRSKRDLLASVRAEKYVQLVDACKQYLRNNKFTYRPMTTKRFARKHSEWYKLAVQRKEDKGIDFNVVYRAATTVKNKMLSTEGKDLKVNFDVFVDAKIMLCYKVDPERLSPTKEISIPLSAPNKDVKTFSEMHNIIRVENGRMYAVVNRKIVDAKTTFKKMILERLAENHYELLET